MFDEGRKEFRLHATYGMSEAMIAAISDQHLGLGNANIGAATTQRKPIQVSDIRNEPSLSGQRDHSARGLSQHH